MADSLPPHNDYPALPAQAVNITPDANCLGCPLAQAGGHKTCNTFSLQNKPEVSASNRINLKQLREMQGQLHRRAFDADGIIGSPSDSWYPYNAARAVNFAWFSLWTVSGVSGDTLTLTPSGDDARSVVFATWSETEQILGYFRINGFYSLTSTQPLDMVEFEWPSKAHYLKSKTLQVTAISASSITVKLDKDLSGIYDKFFPVADGEGGFLDDPTEVKVRIYHYGRESEQWSYVQEPRYFYGLRTQKTILSASLPENGVWELESVVICPPESIDPLNSPNWVLQGWAEGAWVTINEDHRLYINHTGSRVALKTTLPEGSIRNPLTTDLTATYSKFRVVYYAETTQDNSQCSIRGYDRCFNSRIDHSNSVGLYGLSKGAGVSSDGSHVFCSKFIFEKYEYVDEFDKITNAPGSDGIPDRVNVTLHHPEGLNNFPILTGRCIQYGYCSLFENTLSHQDAPEAPFNIDHSMRLLLEMWFSTDKRKIQKYVLAQGPTGFTVERIGHPSILWLNGFFGGLITPGGYHPQAQMRGDNTWFVKKPRTVIDQDGNETLMAPGGLEEGYLIEYDEDGTHTAEDIVGSIPDSVPNFKTKRDPFLPGSTVDQNLLEYIGAQIERDTGQIKDRRGLSGISMALGQEDIIAPGFDVSLSEKQYSSRATFEWDGEDAIITILPYAQPNKETSLGSRIIHSITDLGSNRYKIDFVNTQKTFSRFSLGDLGEIGDSYDEIFTVSAGGGPCILPYEHQGLFSFDGNKNTGSRHAGAAPLDCIDINGNRFVVEEVLPHGGSEASTWGGRISTLKGEIGGFFELPVADDHLPVSDIQVKRTSDDVQFQLLDATSKPPINDEEAWFDGHKRIYFSAGNDADFLEIKYKDATEADFTQYFTVSTTFTVTTQMDYSEYSSSDTQAITIRNTPATIVTGTPAMSEVKVEESWDNKINLVFSIDDALSAWKLSLTFDEEAPEPDDDWAVGGRYKSFGKKRDAIIIRADAYPAGGDYFSINDATGETAEFFRSSTVFLPKADLQVQYTPRLSDSWEDISDFIPNAASGQIRIPASFFSDKSGSLCFKIPGIQMVDNRGQVPSSIINKTQNVLDATQWCMTTMGSGYGNYSYARRLQQYWYRGVIEGCTEQYIEDDIYETIWGGSGNYFFVGTGQFDSNVAAFSTAELSVESSSFGTPIALNNMPDGIEILEAVAVISGAGIIRTKYHERYPLSDCEENVLDPGEVVSSSTIEDISFTVIRYTSANTYTVVGSIPGARNGSKVVDFTAIAQDMYLHRKSSPFGYGLIFTPSDIEGASLDDLLPGEPATRSRTMCPGSTCEGTTFEEYYTTDTVSIHWNNATFGQIALRINYNGKDRLNIVQPRFPSFGDAA